MSPEQQLSQLVIGTAKVLSEKELLEKLRLGRPLRIKLGVDPTAPDIHFGHTVALEKLRQFGNGLKNIQRRMESIQGRFRIENRNGTKSPWRSPLGICGLRAKDQSEDRYRGIYRKWCLGGSLCGSYCKFNH